jgi:ADP-ribose pyrophosphatase YjhB (NUDIX family)
MDHACGVPALYSFVALTFCVDSQQRVLMTQESRPDCRGRYYVPAGRGHAGEDPMHIAWRTTAEKTGLTVEPVGILGIEHNPPLGQFPGQLRVLVLARPTDGVIKMQEDQFSMGAAWIPHGDVRGLKLRSDDFLTWMDDVIAGNAPVLPSAFWRTLGAPV